MANAKVMAFAIVDQAIYSSEIMLVLKKMRMFNFNQIRFV